MRCWILYADADVMCPIANVSMEFASFFSRCCTVFHSNYIPCILRWDLCQKYILFIGTDEGARRRSFMQSFRRRAKLSSEQLARFKINRNEWFSVFFLLFNRRASEQIYDFDYITFSINKFEAIKLSNEHQRLDDEFGLCSMLRIKSFVSTRSVAKALEPLTRRVCSP